MKSIQQITDSINLLNYPSLQLVTVGNWKVVTNKNSFKVGDKVIYISIDSWIPFNTKYSNLLQRYLYTVDTVKGYWIRSIKIAGIISNGLILPMTAHDIQVQHYDREILNKSVLYPYLQDVITNKDLYDYRYSIYKYLDVKCINRKLNINDDIIILCTFKYLDSYYIESIYSTKNKKYYTNNQIKIIANKLKYYYPQPFEDLIHIDLEGNKLITEVTKYVECFNREDNKCKGLLFKSDKYNFIVPSINYYMSDPNTYDPNMSGDYEDVEYSPPSNNKVIDIDIDLTVMDNKVIVATDGNFDISEIETYIE